jgi:hypothetical protein
MPRAPLNLNETEMRNYKNKQNKERWAGVVDRRKKNAYKAYALSCSSHRTMFFADEADVMI